MVPGGIIACRPACAGAAYPSKVITYLSAGCRVVVVVEAESALARLVEREAVGFMCPPGDPRALAAIIRTARSQTLDPNELRSRINEVARKHFGTDEVLDQLSNLLRSIESDLRES